MFSRNVPFIKGIVEIEHTVDGIDMAVNDIGIKINIARTDTRQIDLPQ